jgi:dihydroorotase-like cyclic amidohydrolase
MKDNNQEASMPETIHLPALIDPHVHLREPGINRAETIASGTLAAAMGGYALVADTPNNPGRPTWSETLVREKQIIAGKNAYIPMAVNAGAQPEADNIDEIAGMMELAIALKGYGGPTTGIERQTDYEAKEFEPIIAELHRVTPRKPFLFHAGKDNLADMIDLSAGKYNHHIHVCHVNNPAQVDIVLQAQAYDLPVTCGACPHHLVKDSHDRLTEGKFAEMQPPLADQVDAEKLLHYLAEGKIQIIESDHAPHSKDAKREAEAAGTSCFGVPGIEHIVGLMLYQVKRENITIERLIDAMSTQPAKLFGLQPSSQTGSEWELIDGRIESEADIISGAGWTPYLGMNTYGKLVESRVNGRAVYTLMAGLVLKAMDLSAIVAT